MPDARVVVIPGVAADHERWRRKLGLVASVASAEDAYRTALREQEAGVDPPFIDLSDPTVVALLRAADLAHDVVEKNLRADRIARMAATLRSGQWRP